jgi:hypothetical protein
VVSAERGSGAWLGHGAVSAAGSSGAYPPMGRCAAVQTFADALRLSRAPGLGAVRGGPTLGAAARMVLRRGYPQQQSQYQQRTAMPATQSRMQLQRAPSASPLPDDSRVACAHGHDHGTLGSTAVQHSLGSADCRHCPPRRIDPLAVRCTRGGSLLHQPDQAHVAAPGVACRKAASRRCTPAAPQHPQDPAQPRAAFPPAGPRQR